MTKQEFASLISRDLTSSCVLPVSVPPKEIERIADQSMKWFYENFEDAVEENFFIIPQAEFVKDGWKQKREFQLDDCVVNLADAPREIKGASFLFTMDRDISEDRLWASQIYLSPMNGDELVMRVAQYSFWDLTKAMWIDSLAFSFNHITKKLKIKGRDPRYDVIMRVFTKVPAEKLYENYYFQRWVTAKAKISLASILGRFNINLIGNVTINYSDIRSEGKDEIDEIKEDIKGLSPPDWIITWH